MNISLIGFMGTGKTTVGKKLAERFNYQFIDLDTEIIKEDGRGILEIFAKDGEDYFRDLETKVTIRVAKGDNQIISTGGGVVLREENVEYLKSNGIVILLKASAEKILERTSNENNRPLLAVDDPLTKIKMMLSERREKYQCTPYQIDTTSLTIDEVINKIIEIVNSIQSRN